jgi:hypothetical protein
MPVECARGSSVRVGIISVAVPEQVEALSDVHVGDPLRLRPACAYHAPMGAFLKPAAQPAIEWRAQLNSGVKGRILGTVIAPDAESALAVLAELNIPPAERRRIMVVQTEVGGG